MMKDIDNLLFALQVNQSKYKYDFVIETKFNQRNKTMHKYFSVVKYHTEVIESERFKIQDEAKRGNLVSILNYLAKEYEEVRKS